MKAGSSQLHCLTFYLDGRLFALKVHVIQEVLALSPITPVPRAASTLRGVTNLRGKVVPVLDLRALFGMPETATTVETSIVVVEMAGVDERVEWGALVDRVSEVVVLDKNEIESAPRLGMGMDAKFVKGIGRLDGQFITILDPESLFSGAA